MADEERSGGGAMVGPNAHESSTLWATNPLVEVADVIGGVNHGYIQIDHGGGVAVGAVNQTILTPFHRQVSSFNPQLGGILGR